VQGEPLEEIIDSMAEVAEGVATSRALAKLVSQQARTLIHPFKDPHMLHPHWPLGCCFQVGGYRRDLKYPILFGTAAILDGELTPREGLQKLMEMPLRLEDHW